MTALDIIGQLTAGLRVGLVLLAVMSLLTVLHLEGSSLADRLRSRGAILLAIAVILYSPAHTAWLIGHPILPIVSRTLDAVATMLTCACFIHLLAARAVKRGLSLQRVWRGAYVNVAVLTSIVAAVWLTR